MMHPIGFCAIEECARRAGYVVVLARDDVVFVCDHHAAELQG